MNDLSTLTALRDRVAAATGPDRELDAEIDAALFGGRASHTFTEGTPAANLRRSYDLGTVFDHSDPLTNGGHVLSKQTRHSTKITASIDAALALVERELPGWKPKVAQEDENLWRVHLGHGSFHPTRRPDGGSSHAAGPTAALSILLALLAAKIARTALASTTAEKERT